MRVDSAQLAFQELYYSDFRTENFGAISSSTLFPSFKARTNKQKQNIMYTNKASLKKRNMHKDTRHKQNKINASLWRVFINNVSTFVVAERAEFITKRFAFVHRQQHNSEFIRDTEAGRHPLSHE